MACLQILPGDMHHAVIPADLSGPNPRVIRADVARKFGIRSAMPGFIGRRLCPQLVFVKPDFSKYVRVAAQTRAIFVDYDPDFEAGSLDEGYLDVTDYCHMHSTTGECCMRFTSIQHS